MTQLYSPQRQPLEESNHLIHLLQQQANQSEAARNALARHQVIHNELYRQQVQSEHALAAWRHALTQRWQCEIEGQRIYSNILKKLQHYYGAESPQLQVIVPSNQPHAGAAEDLLNDMRRMHASLLLTQPSFPCSSECVMQLEAACHNLSVSLQETRYYETERRTINFKRRLAEEACLRSIDETNRLLNESETVLHETVQPVVARSLAYAS